MKKVNFKKRVSQLMAGVFLVCLFSPQLVNATNYSYFSKLESTPVYDIETGGGGTIGTPWGGGTGSGASKETLLGFNKNCTFSLVSRCDQDKVGFTPINVPTIQK